jgi:two-component system nitrogen regulation response regulator GlnG
VAVRIIVATHHNLEERVARALFREDLHHRINLIRIELPPLRARALDIELCRSGAPRLAMNVATRTSP